MTIGDRIDRLARRLAAGPHGARSLGLEASPAEPATPGRKHLAGAGVSEEAGLTRGSLLRYGLLGVVAVSFRGVPVARAAGAAVAAGCRGGSLKACNQQGEKTYRTTLALCARIPNDRFGAAKYECYVDTASARQAGRSYCRSHCPPPKKKAPGGGTGGGGGGGTPPPPGGGGRTPTCGHVDCVQGDKCCPNGAEPICCAICCARNGNGCGSSDSDC
jgi:hypothetical protein